MRRRLTTGNRIQKVLEDANIKLGSVASDVLGVSGRAMLDALVAGQEDSAALADLARRRMRGKIPQLREALRGRVTDHHRFQTRLLLDHVAHLDGVIARRSARIASAMAPQAAVVDRLVTVPGIERRTAEAVVAEIGTDMTRFPSAGHLASWAGMCPGNNESAGRRRSGRTTKGSRWLRTVLVQAAWAASHTKNTYLSAHDRRIAARRGKKRAVVALGHTLLVIVYHRLRDGTTYRELGGDVLDRLEPDRLTKRLVRRLEQLGHAVTLQPKGEAA